eukprot:CAMPEP_0114140238 /NCGR_PEP_ID=MMETSP0043_2-20121206/17273_1 /TAXON_ID=464988 /ORGANISM="Hemiselmis andersenii, Strain CCMP644" /LENGTH=58 /DNA_ID=CAMNT_0001234309 /DNA_START=774 /DNA_END=946 /DNA_ORIENTATION=-
MNMLLMAPKAAIGAQLERRVEPGFKRDCAALEIPLTTSGIQVVIHSRGEEEATARRHT